DPPTGSAVQVVANEFEIPLPRANHVDDERQRFTEERLQRLLLSELKEPAVEVALSAIKVALIADLGHREVFELFRHRGALHLGLDRNSHSESARNLGCVG